MGEASITGAGALSKGKVTARNLTSDAKETNGRGETEKGRRRSALIFLADVDLSAGRRPSGLSYIEIYRYITRAVIRLKNFTKKCPIEYLNTCMEY